MKKHIKIMLFIASIAASLGVSFAVLLLFTATNYPVTLFLFGSQTLGTMFRWLAIGIAIMPFPAIIVGIIATFYKKYRMGLIITLIPAGYAISMFILLLLFHNLKFLTH